MLKNKKITIIIAVVLFLIMVSLGVYGFYESKKDNSKDLEVSSSENSSDESSSNIVGDKVILIQKETPYLEAFIYEDLLKYYNSYMNDETYNTKLPAKNLNNKDTIAPYVENGKLYVQNGILSSEIEDSIVSYEEIGDEGTVISVFVTDKNELYYSVYNVEDSVINIKKLVTTEKIKGVKKLYYSGVIDFTAPLYTFYVLMMNGTVKELEYSWSSEEDFKLKEPSNIIYNVDEISIYKDGSIGIVDSTGDDYKIIKDTKYPNIKVDKILYGFGEGDPNTHYIIATDGYLYQPIWNYDEADRNNYRMSLERVKETKIKEVDFSFKSEYNEYLNRKEYFPSKDLIIFFE